MLQFHVPWVVVDSQRNLNLWNVLWIDFWKLIERTFCLRSKSWVITGVALISTGALQFKDRPDGPGFPLPFQIQQRLSPNSIPPSSNKFVLYNTNGNWNGLHLLLFSLRRMIELCTSACFITVYVTCMGCIIWAGRGISRKAECIRWKRTEGLMAFGFGLVLRWRRLISLFESCVITTEKLEAQKHSKNKATSWFSKWKQHFIFFASHNG